MAKSDSVKTKVKRPRRKMKKQVRLTIAGLFLASAIVVAAVPVKETQAEALKADTTTDSRTTYINYDYNPSTDDLNLDPNGWLDPTLPEHSGTNVKESYSVRKLSDGTWSYNWQFKYYTQAVEGSNVRAIICEYNKIYPEKVVHLTNSANVGFVTVEPSDFEAFMADPAKGDKAVAASYDSDYLDYINSGGIKSDNLKFHEDYNNEEFILWFNKCDAYYEYINTTKPNYDYEHDSVWKPKKIAYDAWVAAGSDPDTKPEEPGPEPQAPEEVTKPIDLSKKPRNLDTDYQYRYYIDSNSSSNGGPIPVVKNSGSTLVSVIDNVNGPNADGTAKSVYLVQGGIPSGAALLDEATNFLVKEKSIEIIGISENAFAGVSNVDELTIPEEINYIGDGAFEGSFIKKIDMRNIVNIGNYAFRDCTELADVSLSATKKIGAECFKNTGLTSITFPYSVNEIGYGAFANDRKLSTVDFSAVNSACVLHDYAFFNDYALNSVNMRDSAIKDIGEGCFAITSAPTGGWIRAELPDQITGTTGSNLGDLLFAGRSNLDYVLFPTNYGTNGEVEIPSSMFRNCTALGCADFTAEKSSIVDGYVNFSKSGTSFVYNDLFRDVANPDFYVRGPEKNNAGEKAYPRQSTWQSFTQVSNYVPYVYVDANGIECYEVSDGTYLLQANEKGELTSCELVDQTSTNPIDLVIPKTVGDYEVKTIANGCFDNDNLRNRIRTITIEDDSLTGLDANVFRELPNLTEVHIGNAVAAIGEKCFEGCNKLENVYFNTPAVGYDAFTIGTDAFKTGSSALTFHGDIVPGYAPFEFATGKDSGKIDDNGKRICYMSQSPSYLTCMYDNASGDVVLLDYPKYNELDNRNAAHNMQMEKYYTEKCGNSSAYDNDRNSFYAAWIDSKDDPSAQSALYDNTYYGPWLNKASLDAYLAQYNTDNGTSYSITDIGGYPKDYFESHPYSILDNYENPGSADYQIVTDEELLWISSCLYVEVPEGITSIDATSFFNAPENTRNVATYFQGSKTLDMCTNNHGDADIIPGLFSGYYEDYASSDPDKNKYETIIRGNDRVLNIILHDVKELPDYAFDSCERLLNVTLGDDLDTMGTAPFRGCNSLDDITGNEYFEAQNKIIYIVNPDESLTVKECLPSRGNSGDSGISSATDPLITRVSDIEIGAFEECKEIVSVDLSDANDLKIIPEDCFKDCESLQYVYLPLSVNRIENEAFAGTTPVQVKIPGIEVDIATSAFEHDSKNKIITYEDSAAYDYGKYHGLTVEIISSTYTVRFVDYDGKEIKTYYHVPEGQSVDVPSPDPTRTDYTFTGWSDTGYLKVIRDVYAIAQYKPNSSNRLKVTFYADDLTTVVNVQEVDYGKAAVAPIPPAKAGYTFKAWVPGTFDKVTKDMDIVATYEKNTAPAPNPTPTPSSSTSPSPTATGATAKPSPTGNSNGGSSDNQPAKKYTVTVAGGSGTGSYEAGAIVPINAYDMGAGQSFDKWTTSSAGVGFASATSPSTYFVMPAANVAVTATYKTGSGNSGNGGNSGNSGNGGSGGSGHTGGTVVEINKGGFSYPGVAGATVSGSTDNFIVKITDDQVAADLALTALQNAYGDISRIKYLPMDISLYDSTGTTKITDTAGLSVNITMPLPDELAPYAGNNRVASVVNGQLDVLNSRFTMVDGVPCISFTATHLSPYVIYVDTANLTESTIDYTPKTGDPIHPKWFLAMGLAAISVILFFKKDKKAIKATT